jgi:probable selenium-dependent hydroxylase accessory protein YqeC
VIVEPATTLREALGVGAARIVAFTGGGGKTSALFRLAHELADRRVLVATTTRIWVPRPEQGQLVVEPTLDAASRTLVRQWTRGVRVLGTAITPEGKLQGVPPDWIAILDAIADFVLVEADGAAGKPLTAPRDHEPVIPSAAELVVPVAGVEAVGAPLDAAHVHRVAEIAALTGLAAGARLTADALATVLLDPRGNVKGAPPEARVVPLINKVSTPAEQGAARAVAAALLARGAQKVVLSCLAAEPAVIVVIQADPNGAAARVAEPAWAT